MLWHGNCGIELNITKKLAASVASIGRRFSLKEETEIPAIKRQLKKIDPSALREELLQYGAWDYDDLLDHEANLERILWIASCDIKESKQ